MTDTIEGEAVDVTPEPIRAVAVVEAPDVRLSVAETPEAMVALATRMATVLADVVEKKKLYATISGRKYPQVEAWMTIARMDNVVAREATGGIVRLEDGSYEATVELVRLSDGMVIGRASALCGVAGDKPWDSRGDHHKRSMAVTRATSRAFRQQYSWIMALAGYEPTPAEEMPREDGTTAKADGEPTEELLGRLSKAGNVKKGTANGYKLEARQGPEGYVIGFRLDIDGERSIPQVLVEGPLGTALFLAMEGEPEKLVGQHVTVKGRLYNVKQAGRQSYYRLRATAIEAHEFTIPAEVEAPTDPPSIPAFSDDELAGMAADVDKACAA
jgi:hypothetical protein